MKHIFFIHSHITYIVSVAVIEFEKLKKQDVVFIKDRNYFLPNEEFISYIYPFSTYPDFFEIQIKFWRGYKKLKKLDSFIKSITNEQFLLYVPQTGFGFFPLVISHKLCLGFNIIEEGSAAYFNKNIFVLSKHNFIDKFKIRIISYVNYFNRVRVQLSFFDQDYIKVYGISNYSFPDYSRRCVVPICDIKNNNKKIEYELRCAKILVFDAVLEYGVVSYESFIRGLKKLFLILIQDGVSKIFVKPHPQQYIDDKYLLKIRDVMNKYASEIEVQEIDASICLEEIAFKYNPEFYVNLSSIGIYGILAGCKVYSMAKLLVEECPLYQDRINNMPNIFLQNVEFV